MYKITVEKITTTEYPETKTVYYDNVTKKNYDSSYDIKGDDFEQRKIETGKRLVRKDEEKVFEQIKDDVDISKLAVFLNS